MFTRQPPTRENAALGQIEFTICDLSGPEHVFLVQIENRSGPEKIRPGPEKIRSGPETFFWSTRFFGFWSPLTH